MDSTFHIWNDPEARGGSTRPSNAVLQALAILESFDQERPRQSLAEMSRRLDIPRASALRHLAALEQAGYVVRLPGNVYALAARVLQLSRAYVRHNELLPTARPVLEEIAAETGETAHLGILNGTHVIYVAIAESPQRVRAYVMQGDRIPAHCVASGKAILAHAPVQAVEAVVGEGLAPLSAATITSEDAFEADLAATRSRGYALNVGEWTDEVLAASAPVFGHTGEVVSAIGISGPRGRLDSGRLAEIGELVCRHAQCLSARLGAPADPMP